MVASKKIQKRIEKLSEDIQKLSPEKLDKLEFFLGTIEKRVFSIKEAAEILGQSLDSVRRSIKSGKLKAFQINDKGNWKVPMEEIERLVNMGKRK